MKKFFIYLRTRPLGMISFAALLLLYFFMIFAEFFAPYAPTSSFADKTYHPPNLRFYQGRLQAQEWRVSNSVSWKYVRIRASYEKVRLFGKGEPYKLLGFVPMERHFFTTDKGAYPVFLMGADNLGRDVFSRIIYGSRISLTIGFVATAISLVLAVLLGGLAGYFGGFTDWSIMRACEFFMLIPGLYLILFLRSLLSSSMDSGQAYMMITVILSLVGWPGSARTFRGMIHAIKREEFVMNSRLEMIPSMVIISRDIIPQIASLLIVSVALSIPGFIMTETTLSYLGLGITDPAVSWGSMIKRDISTLNNLRNYSWLLNPVWFLLGVTLAFNFLGDCLRDFFDPYHTHSFGLRFWIPDFLKERKIKKPGLFQNSGSFGTRIKSKAAVSEFDILERLQLNSENKSEVPGLSLSGEDPHPAGSAEGSGSPVLLEVRDLAVSFGILQGRSAVMVHAVRGLSFLLKRGEILGIVGESGSGKSVSTQAIPGLLPVNTEISGSICFENFELLGKDVETLRQYRGKKIGVIYQEPGRSYDPLQNIGNVFLETFRNKEPAIEREAALEKAAALLAEVGLNDGRERLGNFPHQFSGGQLQRIGIALSLAQGCELLIADEPTTALDVTIQKQIVTLLRTLREERGISIIFISHDIDLVAEISDRIMVMYGGLEMEAGDAEEIRSAPRHPYTCSLLAASPRFGSHYSKERLKTIPGKVADPVRPEPGCPFAPRCGEAQPECSNGIPQLRNVDSREIRCIGMRL
ncbi:MAG: dipeptide/oligopeptide/nickel ABC transporter permease/ATP-binding protein [Treponema sp.]|nr:dipeptide/oligopeptide/nickel ABC transporter permease/ATP-binding protein [Treponema sp.]